MPLIRCQKCGIAYDIPPAIAVKLPTSVATCDECGEGLFGNKAALLSRFFETGDLEELDLKSYRIREDQKPAPPPEEDEPFDLSGPQNLRVIARAADDSIRTVYEINEHPLWIGRKGCHVEFDDPELDMRHCSIERRKSKLVVRDSDSHTGTFLDGEAVGEAVITAGTHLLRVGSALICIEPTDEPGMPVQPISLDEDDIEDSPLMRKLRERSAAAKAAAAPQEAKKAFLLCVEGPLTGKEFEIPDEGLTVGREAAVRVPDEFLSRKHFVVARDEEGNLRVRDLGSRNGTFLNTLPAKNTKIHPGDEIRAGVNRFRVEERTL
ncbi:MAG TPA: FHA domain-containing protein [Thermoanaerobaculia bacterium]